MFCCRAIVMKPYQGIIRKPHIQSEAILLLKALAGITGQLDRSAFEATQAIKLDDIQLPSFQSIVRTGVWRKGGLLALQPDLLAAQFLDSVLNKEEMSPGPWLYYCLKLQSGEALFESLSRLGRLWFDYGHDLMESQRPEMQGVYLLMDNLSETIKRDPEFCRELEPAFARAYQKHSLLQLAITMYRTLLKDTDKAETRVGYENKLSRSLVKNDNRAGSLDAIRQRLAEETFATYSPNLAGSLNNLSIRLAESGDRAGALDVIRRAVEIREKLAKESFAAFGPGLAMSLNNLSIRLAESGDRAGGLDAIRRAVEIVEPYANPGTVYAQWFENMKQLLVFLESGEELRAAERINYAKIRWINACLPGAAKGA